MGLADADTSLEAVTLGSGSILGVSVGAIVGEGSFSISSEHDNVPRAIAMPSGTARCIARSGVVLSHHNSRIHCQHPIRVRKYRVEVQFLDLRMRLHEFRDPENELLQRGHVCRRLSANAF